MSAKDSDEADGVLDSERWLVVDGRRWRRTDPVLPAGVVDALKSHLGRARNAVRAAKCSGEADEMGAARTRVGLAKHGLGERGTAWWEMPEAERLERARAALAELETATDTGTGTGTGSGSGSDPGTGGTDPSTDSGITTDVR